MAREETGLIRRAQAGDPAALVMLYDQHHRANLDGSNEEVVVPGVSGEVVQGVAMNASARKLYWTTQRKIYRADLGGSNVTLLIDLGLTPAHILDGITPAPAPERTRPAALQAARALSVSARP